MPVDSTFSRSSGDGGVSPTARLNAASLSPGWGPTDAGCVCDCVCWLFDDAVSVALDAVPVAFCSAILAQLQTESTPRASTMSSVLIFGGI